MNYKMLPVKIKHTLLALVCSFMVVNTTSAALALDSTRYIYDGDATSISAIVNNASDKMYGAQVWVANMDKSGGSVAKFEVVK
ncbi:fimbria/pilus periplasmic chaperone [Photobacterium sp. S4TG1]|uniref:fimbria/pilus periplasmic chaperone n=1 Tax=Photobacterium sp. S4TG1 TaxID=3114587 RepID=UPI002E18F3BC|nr:fimbria/pilus periplasmic chaperone [Photobacterium sp. S4TG1]